MKVKEFTEEGETYQLEILNIDLGWPDEGHDEYFLAQYKDRKSKFWQKVLGQHRKEYWAYGETKPNEEEIIKNIKYLNKQKCIK